MTRFRPLAALLLATTCVAGLSAWPAIAQGLPVPALEQPKLPQELAAQRPLFHGVVDVDLLGGSQPYGLVALRDGSLAFSAFNLGAIGRVDRETRRVSYFHLGKGSKPVAILEGPDGLLFVSDKALNVIHRVNAETGETTRIAMPPDTPKLDLAGMRLDLNGRLWFAGSAGWLGSYDIASGQVEVSSHDDLLGLGISAIGANGAIWFVAGKSGRMVRIDPNRARFDSASLPDQFRGARGITVAPDGAVWISSFRRNLIGRNAGRGQWNVIALPWPESQPHALLARSDGTLLVADGTRRVLYRYSPQLDRFDEVAQLGDGGHIKAMVEIPGGVAITDMGSDRIRIFLDDAVKAN